MAARDAFVEQMQSCDPERLIFLDESSSHISMTRTWAWAPCGKRAQNVVPRNRGRVTTMLGALSIDGIEAMMTVEGGTTAKFFLEFLDLHLAPKLRPGDIVVMDNLGAHHASGVRERIEARGEKVVYQPPYSPGLNPIELAWSKIKAALRGLGALPRQHASRQLRHAVSPACLPRCSFKSSWHQGRRCVANLE